MITLGLIGKHLAHSFSQKYFTERFAESQIDGEYLFYECSSRDNLQSFLESTNALGCNVTIPYKQEILDFIARPDALVQAIGATNCIKKEEGQWIATNTDVFGFQVLLAKVWQSRLTKAIVLGNGGASQAVQYVLRQKNISFIVVSRTIAPGIISYADLPMLFMNYHLIINTTSLGMFPHVDTMPPIPYADLSQDHVCLDLVYNPDETEFMRRARAQGSTVMNGLDMLYAQADAAWDFFMSS
jgi:shikimate dehydrogenase